MMRCGPVRFLSVLIVAVGLPGCAGVWVSSRPVYPADWPAMEISQACPDLSGRYRMVSDEAAPLVYPPGGHPRQMIMFVSYGDPEPVPTLGRRVLAWHLAGAFQDRDVELWNSLATNASPLDSNPVAAAEDAAAGWVEIRGPDGDTLAVRAGRDDAPFLEIELREESKGLWTYKSHVFQCEAGGVAIVGSFPPPPVENPYGSSAAIGAQFTFYRTIDGSLVALEEAHTGVGGGNMVFKKWWRWRRLE